MNKLEELRNKIDRIDEELINLFEERMKCAKGVAEFKKTNSASVLQSDREKQVINKALSNLKNKDLEAYVPRLMGELMEMSKDYQRTMYDESVKLVFNRKQFNQAGKVGFFGAIGSNTHRAAIEYFNKDDVISYSSFEGVFKAVNDEEIEYGVLPIENSSTGAIADVYDLLGKYNLYIVGEKWIRINHALLAIEGATLDGIEEVFSHPQGISQCKDFLMSKCIKQNFDSSTSSACNRVKNSLDKHIAAIADPINAEIYGLKVLKNNIASYSENFTRFVIISKALIDTNEANKVSVHFVLKNDAGSLYNALKCFAHHGVNMIKIESRPIKNNPMNYSFYVDLEGNCKQKDVLMAIQYLQQNCTKFKILGEYKIGSLEE